ncbi:MAG: CotH kinase family protein, partial [Flavobacteriales bacterium]|nr:CotH kinase family protein [Flavobacteriales bacterium]
RRNMGAVGSAVAFDAFATGQHEALIYTGGAPETIAVDPSILIAGSNTLSVQIHNRSLGSSDLTCRPFLLIGISTSQTVYGDAPPWFLPPMVLTSYLPIVILNTNGQPIPDDPRIVAEMGIIDNGPGQLNNEEDTPNDYNGLINIERRGSSSGGFPKKQYALETQDIIGNSLDVSLLGLPIENDWILHAPYSDKSLMRNYLTYYWWRKMGWYTTRTRFCEVILNGDYQGVYILMEQIKWDNDRVDVEKLDTDDIAGDSLTGGYIIKVDKITGSGQTDWASHVDTFQGTPKNINFQYDYPKRDLITTEQEDYIQQFFYDWEQSLVDSTFMGAATGYRKYVDVNSFIDYFLVEEITKNVDGYRLSTYLNKQRDSRGGKLQAGPAWDFNITLGNANYCEGGEIENWALDFPCSQAVIPFWWHRMNQDSVYWNQLQCRWQELRSGLFSNERLNADIDSNVALLGDAATRNFNRWNILNTYVWPNNFVGGTYEAEIDYLKSWLMDRVAWLDTNIGAPSYPCSSAWQEAITISEINYNSIDTFDTDDWFELQNLTSDTLDVSFWAVYDKNEFNTYTFPMGTYILPDSFLVVAKKEDLFAGLNPLVTNRVGSFNWGMGNGGDRLTIRDFWNDFVLTVKYKDTIPWPIAPDGNGQTLEKWDWATDLNDPASWHEGCPGGSPGRSFEYCVYVGIEEDALTDIPFGLYPNPADEQFWVELNEAATLSVYSMTGQKVQTRSIVSGKTSVDVSGLTSGLYLVDVITQSNARYSQQVVVR